jgi:hypothetical protein
VLTVSGFDTCSYVHNICVMEVTNCTYVCLQHVSLRQPVEKCYCLSVAKVSYGRETFLPTRGDLLNTSECAGSSQDTPTHRLVVYDLKGAWTKSNRDVAFALFDTFMKTKVNLRLSRCKCETELTMQ